MLRLRSARAATALGRVEASGSHCLSEARDLFGGEVVVRHIYILRHPVADVKAIRQVLCEAVAATAAAVGVVVIPSVSALALQMRSRPRENFDLWRVVRHASILPYRVIKCKARE